MLTKIQIFLLIISFSMKAISHRWFVFLMLGKEKVFAFIMFPLYLPILWHRNPCIHFLCTSSNKKNLWRETHFLIITDCSWGNMPLFKKLLKILTRFVAMEQKVITFLDKSHFDLGRENWIYYLTYKLQRVLLQNQTSKHYITHRIHQ